MDVKISGTRMYTYDELNLFSKKYDSGFELTKK